MGFGKLLEQKLIEKNIKQAELAEAIGLPKTTLSSMLSRDTSKVEIEVFLDICRYIDCDPEEFYNEFEKEKKKPLPPSFVEKYNVIDDNGRKMVNTVLDLEYERCNNDATGDTFIFRRLSENRASAGCGYDLNDPDQWREIEVIDTPEARQADFAVEVEGASMEPDYHDGDIVYISLASEIPVGQVGLFIQNGKGYIKEAGDGCIISRNPDYDDIFPENGDIECKGLVIGTAELPM